MMREQPARDREPVPKPLPISGASRPGCSISTTRSIRITSICGSRSMYASAITSSDFLKVTHDEAFRLQKDYYKRYGTTHARPDEGARAGARRIPRHACIRSITRRSRPIRRSELRSSDCPGRKLILTNGTRNHADEVMRRLGIDQHFEDIFDIKAAELEPKPNAVVYERFLARHDVDPHHAVLFEDLARNLEVPHALGMATVLVVPQGAGVVLREDWELSGRDAPHVDHVTDDLAGFLRAIASAVTAT